MDKFKIVADSSADIFAIDSVPYSCAPLKIITAEKEFTDNSHLNICEMTEYLSKYKDKSSTSCPNPEDWLKSFGEAENIFCVTISGTLSGSYNAALTAKEIYLETHPKSNIFVINSLSAGPGLTLIIEKLRELILEGLSYDEICKKIIRYQQKTGLLFVLESMKNLANNGRVSALAAKAAGLLGIRVIGKASEQGDLEQLSKCRGEEKTLKFITEFIEGVDAKGKIIISHCFNLEAAKKLKEMLKSKFPNIDIKLQTAKGLCSFYAEKGGMIIGYET